MHLTQRKTSQSQMLPYSVRFRTSRLISPISGKVRRRDGRDCSPGGGGGAVATYRLMVGSDVITSTDQNLSASERRTTLDAAATARPSAAEMRQRKRTDGNG